MWRTGLLGVVVVLTTGTGCHSCGERHPLWDRITGHDRDSTPSRTAGADPGCRDGCGPVARPVSYGLGTPVPTGGFMGPVYTEGTPFPAGIGTPPGRSDELPLPANIPPTNLPATPSVAEPLSRRK